MWETGTKRRGSAVHEVLVGGTKATRRASLRLPLKGRSPSHEVFAWLQGRVLSLNEEDLKAQQEEVIWFVHCRVSALAARPMCPKFGARRMRALQCWSQARQQLAAHSNVMASS